MNWVAPSLAKNNLIDRRVKRGIDVCLAASLLLIGLPFIILIAVMVKFDSSGPALYRQRRVGLGGRLFELIKFRTMYSGAEDDLEAFLMKNPKRRFGWEAYQKFWNDPRLTRSGKWLRRFSLDELPQLWNVLRGEMSLVGPRPILPSQRAMYGSKISYYRQVQPGMTGLWQVSGRNLTSFSERVDLDVGYIQNWSLREDIRILCQTISVVLSGAGSF